jgi:hypothetical protein
MVDPPTQLAAGPRSTRETRAWPCGSWRLSAQRRKPHHAALRARRLPRTAAPAPAATSRRRNDPAAARRELVSAVNSAPDPANHRAMVTGTRDGTPRIVRVGPFSLNGAPHPRSARTHLRRAVDPGASADPAGLTARARPKARPETRAANLRSPAPVQGDPQSRFCTSVVFPVAGRAGVNKAAGCGVRLIPAHLGYWP